MLLVSSCTIYSVQAQKTGGKKLESSEKVSPSKMNQGKVKTSRRSKAKGNPNKGGKTIVVGKPAKWDWNKIMWFKVRKSDYKTNEAKSNKKTKYKQYSNEPHYKTERREPGDSDVKLKRPLIPFDSRVADEGPVLIKKTERGDKVDGDKILSKKSNSKRKPYNNDKLETSNRVDYSDSKKDDKKLMVSSPPDYKANKMDGDKLMTIKRNDDKPKPYDDSKLMTIKRDDKKPNPYDDSKLMTIKRDDKKPKPYDDSKLMTIKRDDKKPKPYDDSKLMTIKRDDKKPKPYDDSKLMTIKRDDKKPKPYDDSKLMTIKRDNKRPKPYNDSKLMYVKVSKPNKNAMDDDKLMYKIPEIERAKVHGDKLLTVPEKHYPTATMKRISEELAEYKGDYERKIVVTKDSHPGSRYMAAKSYRIPWLKRTQISLALFWTGLWDSNIQPPAVTEKKPKHRRDKKEGKIWDNTVHPSEWNKTEGKAESSQN